MVNVATDAGLLVGCSVIGPNHVEEELPCQDAWCAERLDGNRYVIAVADGLGSADLSHEGAELATSVAVENIVENVTPEDQLDTEATEGPIRNAIETARSALSEKAADLGQPPKELNTTLLVAIAGPSGVAGAVVGDGGIVCADGEEYSLLVHHENEVVDLRADHVTVPLMHDNWEQSYRFDTHGACDGVAVFSDGLEEFTWDRTVANPSFFDAIFGLVRDHDDPERARETLADELKAHPINKFGDDKTIVIYDPPAEFEGDKVETASDEVLTLEDTVGYGENSSIARIEESNSDALKLFAEERRSDGELEEKIRTMVASETGVETGLEGGLAWPIEIVQSEKSGQFVGYRFPLTSNVSQPNILEVAEDLSTGEQDGSSSSPILGRVLKGFRKGRKNLGAERFEIALSLSKVVAAVHQQGHAFGNLNHETLLVDGTDVCKIDCDTLHIDSEDGVYEGADAAARYRPPEGTEDTLTEIQQADRFGLAVHIFQLLMEGHHPYEAQGTAATNGQYDEMIRLNPYPYREPQSNKLEPPEGAPSYTNLPDELQNLCNRCFIEGKSHPAVRPDAEEWVKGLESVLKRR